MTSFRGRSNTEKSRCHYYIPCYCSNYSHCDLWLIVTKTGKKSSTSSTSKSTSTKINTPTSTTPAPTTKYSVIVTDTNSPSGATIIFNTASNNPAPPSSSYFEYQVLIVGPASGPGGITANNAVIYKILQFPTFSLCN